MMAGAKEYGIALYTLAEEEKKEKQYMGDLDAVCEILAGNKDYLNLLSNPAIQKSERLGLLDKAFSSSIDKNVLNFCKILLEKSALNILPACRNVFKDSMYEAFGILPVTAKTAVKLTKEQSEALKNKLQSDTGKTVELLNVVDEGLLGGVKLIYGGKEVDGTTAGRLEALHNILMQ